MSKLQLEVIQESQQGIGEKPHTISQEVVFTETDQLTDKLYQVFNLILGKYKFGMCRLKICS